MSTMHRAYCTLVAAMLMAAAQNVRADPAEFDFLFFAALENFHADKQWCDENYPELKSKNEAIFGRSIYSRMTGESYIQAHASEDRKQGLLAALSPMRAERRDEYQRMPAAFLQQMCSAFDRHLGENGTGDARGQPNGTSK